MVLCLTWMGSLLIVTRRIALRGRSFLESVGRSVSDTELDFILDGRKREEILEYFLGKLDSDQIAEYGHRKDELLRSHADGLEPMIGVVEFLDRLCNSGVRTALATRAGSRRACGTLEKLGLAHYFETIVTGDDVAAGKPDPAIYRLVADSYAGVAGSPSGCRGRSFGSEGRQGSGDAIA